MLAAAGRPRAPAAGAALLPQEHRPVSSSDSYFDAQPDHRVAKADPGDGGPDAFSAHQGRHRDDAPRRPVHSDRGRLNDVLAPGVRRARRHIAPTALCPVVARAHRGMGRCVPDRADIETRALDSAADVQPGTAQIAQETGNDLGLSSGRPVDDRTPDGPAEVARRSLGMCAPQVAEPGLQRSLAGGDPPELQIRLVFAEIGRCRREDGCFVFPVTAPEAGEKRRARRPLVATAYARTAHRRARIPALRYGAAAAAAGDAGQGAPYAVDVVNSFQQLRAFGAPSDLVQAGGGNVRDIAVLA